MWSEVSAKRLVVFSLAGVDHSSCNPPARECCQQLICALLLIHRKIDSLSYLTCRHGTTSESDNTSAVNGDLEAASI